MRVWKYEFQKHVIQTLLRLLLLLSAGIWARRISAPSFWGAVERLWDTYRNKNNTTCKLIGDQTRKDTPGRWRVLIALKTVNIKFLFVLCWFDSPAQDVLWQWRGAVIHGMELDQDGHLPLFGCGWEVSYGFAFLSLSKMWLITISWELRNGPGQSPSSWPVFN